MIRKTKESTKDLAMKILKIYTSEELDLKRTD